MVTFTKVDPNDISTERPGHRGKLCYPIIKAFMETGFKVAKPDLSQERRKPESLRVSLQAYIDRHGLPIKLFAAGGALHFMRVDIDNDGKEIPNWRELANRKTTESATNGQEPTEINADTVARRMGA